MKQLLEKYSRQKCHINDLFIKTEEILMEIQARISNWPCVHKNVENYMHSVTTQSKLEKKQNSELQKVQTSTSILKSNK